jgi:predicted kinase
MWGQSPEKRLPPDAYSKAHSDLVYERLRAHASDALVAGQCVIVDAVFLQEVQRRMIEELAQRLGVPFIGIWLDVPRNCSAERIKQRNCDASDATEHVLDTQSQMELGTLTWTRVDAALTTKDVQLIALKLLPMNSLPQPQPQSLAAMQTVAPQQYIQIAVSKL